MDRVTGLVDEKMLNSGQIVPAHVLTEKLIV